MNVYDVCEFLGLRQDPERLDALPWVVQCCLCLGPDCSYILQGLE